ncbi:hypothetical protein ASPWEDRAFT_32172 [Aspergillus wentii DTO 134E9]|uniref:Uncharacterized protein n=1 Tax=Aspergillus wentii DTO 134E9 TaxID=1073089 RepID=A0A1L9R9F1_ASPWE|nr:uncharacterized protein ASPWEDRAFT_32172 [Aspergillus wentii DTO 134E9]OJJ31546.1 hypothetical protein ASPWEDRAFT_32172 [Aspergillus wentii DTO 134E9]
MITSPTSQTPATTTPQTSNSQDILSTTIILHIIAFALALATIPIPSHPSPTSPLHHNISKTEPETADIVAQKYGEETPSANVTLVGCSGGAPGSGPGDGVMRWGGPRRWVCVMYCGGEVEGFEGLCITYAGLDGTEYGVDMG